VIFRNTPQWFIRMDQPLKDGRTLRETALAAIDETAFYPARGQNRIRAMVEGTGTTKSNAWIDYGVLEACLRADLEARAPRAMAVLDPLKLEITNHAEVLGEGFDPCHAPAHPKLPELGERHFSFGPLLWIEREDFMEEPAKGYHRLFPGNRVRLKAGHVVECTGCTKDASGQVVAVQARVLPDTKSGTPGADAIKVKGVITWVAAHEAVPAEFRLFDRLFTDPQPDAGGKDFLAALNPQSLRVVQGYVEPALAQAQAASHWQFERHGYFVADRVDHAPGRAVFNRTTTLKDTWSKPS
jgi:glutaminyl-tRNA synthetase